MSVNLGSATGYLDLDTSRFLANFEAARNTAIAMSKTIEQRVGDTLLVTGQKISAAGMALTKGVTLPLVAMGGLSLKFSKQYETALAKVSTISDDTKVPIKQFGKEFVKMSNEMGESAESLALAAYEALSASVDTKDAVGFTAKATKLAVSGFTDASSAVDVLTTILNAYGKSAEEVTHISDVLIKTQNLGKVTVNELAGYMGKVIPTANAFEVSLEQLGTMYSLLTSKGIKAAESTTYMNGMMNELGKSSSKVATILKDKTGKNFKELTKDGKSMREILAILEEAAKDAGLGFNDLWSSQEAGKAALSLVSTSVEGYNNMLKDFQTTVGDTDEAYKKMTNTTEFKFKRSIERAKNTLITMGETLKGIVTPYIDKASDAILKLSNYLANLTEEEKKQILKLAGLAAAFGPVLFVVGKVVTSLGTFMTIVSNLPTSFAVLKSGFTIATTSIANFGEAIALAKAGFPALATQTSVVGAAIGSITAPIAIGIAAVAAFVGAFITMMAKSEKFRNKIKGLFKGMGEDFEEFEDKFFSLISELGPEFESFVEMLETAWMGFSETIEPLLALPFEQLSVIVDTSLKAVLAVTEAFVALLQGDTERAGEAMKTLLEVIMVGQAQYVANAIQAAIGLVSNILGLFGTSIGEVVTNTKTKFDELKEKFLEGLKNLPYNIGFILSFVVVKVGLFAVDLLAKGIEAGNKLKEGIEQTAQQIPGKVWELLLKAIEKVNDFVVKMKELGLKGMLELLAGLLVGLGETIIEMTNAGGQIVDGLWEGIKSKGDWLAGKMGEFFKGIVDGAKAALEIKSPSRKFKNEIGKWILPGIVVGVEETLPQTISNLRKALVKIPNALSDVEFFNQQSLAFAGVDLGYVPRVQMKRLVGAQGTVEKTSTSIHETINFYGTKRLTQRETNKELRKIKREIDLKK